MAKKSAIPLERVSVNIPEYDDTSAASIAIGLDKTMTGNRIKKGDKILPVVFGAGFTWDSVKVEL